jgi:molybdopterin-guanine dinucleotide biosynthesis protein A
MGAVLAGGAGRRMGQPKAAVELGGRPLISYALEALEQAGIESVVVAKRKTPLPELDVAVWTERDEPSHPAVGIVTALQRSPSETVIVVGCDLPFITPELLSYMSSLPDAIAVPYLGRLFQPLLGRYPRVIAPSFAYGLGNELPMQQIVSDLGPRRLTEEDLAGFGDLERLFFNINTPEDLKRAEQWLE